MRIDSGLKLDFKDVLIRPKRSTLFTRSDVALDRTYVFKHSKQQWSGVPVIASNMDTTGTFEMASALSRFRVLTAIHKHYTVKEWKAFIAKKEISNILPYLIISTGIQENDLLKLDELMSLTSIQTICIDVANGYSEKFVECVRELRTKYQNVTIMAGNVVTGEMTEELILSGADVVKVGIGPGSVCTTRTMTGVGYPQLSAIIECADAAHGLGGLIISDGGCVFPGDVTKAFGGGADFVMLGGMLAGHEEAGGETVCIEDKIYKRFYGMSSAVAMAKHSGGVANYRASEGKEVLIPFRGTVDKTMQNILGGIRSACTYVGAHSLKELSKRTTFVRINSIATTNEFNIMQNSEA